MASGDWPSSPLFVVKADDSSIPDSLALYRRVHPNHVVPDRDQDCFRVSTAAFKDYELSIVLDDTLEDAGRSPSDCLAEFPDHFLLGIEAGTVRAENQIVVRTPCPEEEAHGDIIGEKKPKSRLRRFVDASVWKVAPDGACE